MDKTFNPKQIEQFWNTHYTTQKIGAPSSGKQPFCIMIPPPNVTGTLHMGHGFQLTLMDTLVRYNRMSGNNTLWQMGTDHAGIATQMVVERQLAEKGQDRKSMGRAAFTDAVWEWKNQSGDTIKNQIKRLGASVDWDNERFTLDPEFSEAVEHAFVSLYRDGLIYRGNKLVNWDPTLQSAVSDLEVINEERPGSLWHIRYPLSGQAGHITVATTRPETLFGDTAIAVSPEDARFAHLIGQSVTLPLTEKTIPIIADEHVDPAFGTGCVKVTPAHDFNDYAIGLRHDLPMINILKPNACLNENVPKPYQGLDRNAARQAVIDDLSAQGLLEKEEPHTVMVPIGERSGSIIEPYLTPQWFVKTQEMAGKAMQAVKEDSCRFHPKNWENTFFAWLENIEDWCISRQLWWGHRIPAWQDVEGNFYVGTSEANVRAHYQLDDSVTLQQEEDVLDTWFSSALWPFATLGWPKETKRLETFFPTQVLMTGFDIIFFWVARMMMFSLYFTKQVPFKDIYITGLIRDHDGQKMSKSKGNILDPIDLIDGISLEALIAKRTKGLMQPNMRKSIENKTKKLFPDGVPESGTDALRFTFAALATPGRDIRFDANRLIGYRNFCNKIWNAARYITMHVDTEYKRPEMLKHPINIWLSHALHMEINTLHQHLNSYRFDLYAQGLYELIWNTYCDWYLELTKPALTSNDTDTITETKAILIHSLQTILALAHPLMPFITDEISCFIRPFTATPECSLTHQPYPQSTQWQANEDVYKEMECLQRIISAIRSVRSEIQISPNQSITVLLTGDAPFERATLDKHQTLLMRLAKIDQLKTSSDTDLPASASCMVNTLSLHIPLAGLIDTQVECARLEKALLKLDKTLTGISKRLENASYIENAPAHLVEKERQKYAQQLAERTQMENQLQKLRSI